MSELKPCPFCGGSNLEVVNTPQGYFIGCSCGCFTGDFETEAEAIDAWNTRESQPCYADEADHSRCKYSVNRGWVERTCKQKRLFNLISRECDGEYYQWHDEEMPCYCPSCGAKVVEE